MTTIGRPSNLQAAAIPLRRRDLRSPTKGRKLFGDSLEDRLWGYYHTIPAIGNYVQVLSNSADLVAYYPGVIDPESSEPVQLEDGPVIDLWEEIGGETAVSEWVSSLVVHLSVAGQGWFVPLSSPKQLAQLDDPSEDGAEPPTVTWAVTSTADLRDLLQVEPATAIPEEDNRIWRIYTPDPQHSNQPDSPVRRVSAQANILTLIDRRAEADLHSRIHAGVWPLPATLKSMTTPSGKLWADILEEGLISAAEPGALESRVPLMAFMEADEIEAIKPPVKLSVDDGEWVLKLEEKTLRQLAIGLDAPIELTTGIGGLNHWSAWLIQEETYTQHLDPLIVRILRSLQPWWQAQVAAKGIANPEDHVIWRNPATAINRPDTFAESKDLWDRGVLSDDALLRAADRDDKDKPTPEELAERTTRLQPPAAPVPGEMVEGVPTEGPPSADDISKRVTAAGALIRAGFEAEASLAAVGLPPVKHLGYLPVTIRTQEAIEAEAVQAATSASRPLALARLARRLANIDQTALIRLEAEAARQLRKHRKALLARIETAALEQGLTAAVDTLVLGKDVVGNLLPGNLAEPDDFNAEALALILLQAQQEAAAATATVGIERDTEADAEDRNVAVGLLLEALAGAVVASLFKRPDTTGELGIDGAEWVPTSDLRRAMDVAGGGPAVRHADEASELIGNGKRTVDGLSEAGIETDDFRWVYGAMPRKNFEPHLRLDGETFDNWQADVLRQQDGSWVSGEFFYPGDHRGCRCSFERVLVLARPAAEFGEGGGLISPNVGGEGNISTNGMSATEAAAYLSTRRDLTTRYPRAASRVRHWGTGEDPQSMAALRAEMERVGATFDPGDVARQRLISETIGIIDSGGTWDAAYSRAYGTLESAGLRGLNLRNADGTSTIIVRPGLKPETAPWKVATNWDPVRYAATHEFGHVIEHDWMTRLADRTPLAAGSEIEQGLATLQDAIARAGYNAKVSDYGRTNLSEGFAELFVSNELGGVGQSRFALLAELAEQAERWASWGSRSPTSAMKSIDWINALLDIGERTPISGTFPTG